MTLHRLPLRTLALGILLAGARALAGTPASTKNPIHPLASRPTKQLIERALSGGVCWGGRETEGDSFELHRDGTVSYGGGEIPNWECTESTRLSVSADAFQWTCNVVTHGGQRVDENGDPVEGQPLSVKKTTFRYQVRLVSPDLLVVQSKADGRHVFVFSRCTQGEQCRDCGEGDNQSLVELVPGSPDGALFEKVKARCASESELRDMVLFEGGPAHDPRTTSEIFYATAESKHTAEYLAGLLRPLIGSVEAKPWPGAWDYDVVVVVGRIKAP